MPLAVLAIPPISTRLLLAGLIPTRKVLIADWDVMVTDETNHSVAGVRVSQFWSDYTLGLSGGLDLFTNAEGKVTFAEREQRAPILYWLARAFWTKLTYGAHASSGTVGTVRFSDPQFAVTIGANCEDSSCTTSAITSQLRVLGRQ
jgi:hypothetical protein